MKTIELPCYGIVIELGLPDPRNTVAYLSGRIVSSDMHDDGIVMDEEDVAYEAAIDAIESLILAHACAGVDVTAPAYLEGIETAVQACSNNV